MGSNDSLPPREFIWRRIHSLLGLWLVFFIFEHLITNSQVAMVFGIDEKGFIRFANFLHKLPYLKVVEVVFLGIPIALHAVFGIRYALQGKRIRGCGRGTVPTIKRKERSRAYKWQRVTSWVLLLGIILHVAHMRFYLYPTRVEEGGKTFFLSRLKVSDELYHLESKVGFTIYSLDEIESMERASKSNSERKKRAAVEERYKKLFAEKVTSIGYSAEMSSAAEAFKRYQAKEAFFKALEKNYPRKGEVVGKFTSFGTALLVVLKNSFLNLYIAICYSLFVLAATFHAFNGLWSFFISWGVVIKVAAQKGILKMCKGLGLIFTLLGFLAIWGSYIAKLLRRV